MLIAKEGLREITLATLVLGACAVTAGWFYWLSVIPFALLWLWVIAFFRDPVRQREFDVGELCSPADGTITEVSELDGYEGIDGPVVRIGMFLSLFNVHVNRMPCAGCVRSTAYRPGKFLDARNEQSGALNESNTLVIDPDEPLGGPIIVRQVAGLVARRIICHAQAGQQWAIGARFGIIKFGSRTELIVPRLSGTQITVGLGDKVRAGLTVLARQPHGVKSNAQREEESSTAVCRQGQNNAVPVVESGR